MAQWERPRAQMVFFFGLPLYLAESCCNNPQCTRGTVQYKSIPGIRWLVGVTICTIFQLQSTSTSPVFCKKTLLKKKLAEASAHWTNYWIWIERAWAPGRTCTPIPGYFHNKTKISKKNLQVEDYLLLRYSKRQCTLRPPKRAKSLTKYNTKMQDFKHVLNFNCE